MKNEKPDLKVVFVTPVMARNYVEGDRPRNRSISPSTVKKYRAAMKKGKFPDGTQIAVNPRGELVDGQHRMKALSELIGEVEGYWFGVLTTENLIFDVGSSRNAANLLELKYGEKIKNARAAGTAITAYFNFIGKEVGKTEVPDKYPGLKSQLVEALDLLTPMRAHINQARLTVPLLAGLLMAHPDAKDFVMEAAGFKTDPESAAGKMRAAFAAQPQVRRAKRSVILQALDYHRAGKRGRAVKFTFSKKKSALSEAAA